MRAIHAVLMIVWPVIGGFNLHVYLQEGLWISLCIALVSGTISIHLAVSLALADQKVA